MKKSTIRVGYILSEFAGGKFQARIMTETGWKRLRKDEAIELGVKWSVSNKSRADNPNSKHYAEKMPLIGSKSPEHAGKLKKHQGERAMRIKSTDGMRLIRVDSKTEIYAHPHETDSEVIARWEAKRNKAA